MRSGYEALVGSEIVRVHGWWFLRSSICPFGALVRGTIEFCEFVSRVENVKSGALKLGFSRRENHERVSGGGESRDDEVEARGLDGKFGEWVRCFGIRICPEV